MQVPSGLTVRQSSNEEVILDCPSALSVSSSMQHTLFVNKSSLEGANTETVSSPTSVARKLPLPP